MARLLIRTGYDFVHEFTARNDGDAEDLSAASSITASLIGRDKETELVADITQTNTSPASWLTGLIVLRFTAAQTATLTSYYAEQVEINPDGDPLPVVAYIEVAVVLGGLRLAYEYIPVFLELGNALS